MEIYYVKQAYRYAALRSGNTCSCTDQTGLLFQLDGGFCSTSCEGDPALHCGGQDVATVYDISLDAGSVTHWTNATSYLTSLQISFTSILSEQSSDTAQGIFFAIFGKITVFISSYPQLISLLQLLAVISLLSIRRNILVRRPRTAWEREHTMNGLWVVQESGTGFVWTLTRYVNKPYC